MCKNCQKQIKRNGIVLHEPKWVNKTCACEISEHRKIQSVDELENCLKLVIARASLYSAHSQKISAAESDQVTRNLQTSATRTGQKNESCKSCWRFLHPYLEKIILRVGWLQAAASRALWPRSVLLRAQTHINIHHLLAGARKKHTHTPAILWAVVIPKAIKHRRCQCVPFVTSDFQRLRACMLKGTKYN